MITLTDEQLTALADEALNLFAITSEKPNLILIGYAWALGDAGIWDRSGSFKEWMVEHCSKETG